MATQTETQPPCTVALIHRSGAKSPPGHTYSSSTHCAHPRQALWGLGLAVHRGEHGAPEEPGGCDGSAGWLLVLRQHFLRKQKQLAQQNKMYTGSCLRNPQETFCSFLEGKAGDNCLFCFLPQQQNRASLPSPDNYSLLPRVPITLLSECRTACLPLQPQA